LDTTFVCPMQTVSPVHKEQISFYYRDLPFISRELTDYVANYNKV